MREINIARSNVRAIQLLLIFGIAFFGYQAFKDYQEITGAKSAKDPLTIISELDFVKKRDESGLQFIEYSDDIKIQHWIQRGNFQGAVCGLENGIIDDTIIRFINKGFSKKFRFDGLETEISQECFSFSTTHTDVGESQIVELLDRLASYKREVEDLNARADYDFSIEKFNLKFSENNKALFACSPEQLKGYQASKFVAFLSSHAQIKASSMKRIQHPDNSCLIVLFAESYPTDAVETLPDELSAYIKKRIPALGAENE